MTQPPTRKNNPYRSLAAFQDSDADVFFGREELSAKALAELFNLMGGPPGTARWLSVLGPSGSGKSSFARAGLLAQLERREGGRLRSATLVPGSTPMVALAEAVAEVCGVSDIEAGQAPGSPFNPLPAGCPETLVLLVDQFEEVWSLCKDATERDAFIAALIDAARAEHGRVAVTITLRSDFLVYTQRHPELEPARRAGYNLDEDVVGSLIEQTLGREGVLPLLQFVLNRIWLGLVAGRSEVDTLRELGDGTESEAVGGALAKAAEEEYQSLDETDRAIARRAFLAMVQLGEGARDTRRRVPERRLLAGVDAGEVEGVLNRFAHPDRRLITRAGDGSGATVEVTHEALFAHWQRLQDWLEKSRDDLRLRRRLEQAVAECRQARDKAKDATAAEGAVAALLWRPPRLTELEQYCERHADEPLDKEEDAFLLAAKAE